MAQRGKVITWGLGLGLLVGLAAPSRSQDAEKQATVTIEAEHEPLLNVIKKICAAQGIGFVANDAALERAGKISLNLRDVPVEQALDVICDAYSLDAHVRNKILVVRPRPEGSAPSAVVEQPKSRRFLPEESRPEPTPTPRVEKQPEVPGLDSAPVMSASVHVTQTTGGGRLIVGTVVEVLKDGVKVKEASGDPRDFFVPQGDDEGARSSRMALALKRLKAGDRIALEYRVIEGKQFLTNLVGGGNPHKDQP
ncbi:MAG TPA: hypothetical protein VFF73_19785 [Planctomycetota bacterium]|nr:hypothetical protein [Planctomycetota bacterium]